MTVAKKSKAIIVGVFTLVGIAIFIIAVLTLGGQRKIFMSSISIKASFNNINGLDKGNNVWFQGVNIGTVKSISFSDDSRVVVQMNIEKKSCKYLYNDAKAKIGSDGLMGNRIVVIEGGNAASPVIKDGDTLAVEKALTTEELVSTLQKNNLNLLSITGDLKEVSKSVANGDGTIGALLKEKSLLYNLQSVVTTFKQASAATKQVTSDLAAYSSKLQASGGFSNDLITDTVIFSKLRASVSQIYDISKTVNDVVNNLNKASESLNDSSRLAGALIHDSAMRVSINELIQNLRTASVKLNDDLEAVQHNFLFQGYFRKKAKQEKKEPN